MRCKVGGQEEYRGADEHVGIEKTEDNLARANGVRRYGHVLRRPREDVLMKPMVHEVEGKHKKSQLKMKYREQNERSMKNISLRKEDVADRCRYREGVGKVAEIVTCIRLLPFT